MDKLEELTDWETIFQFRVRKTSRQTNDLQNLNTPSEPPNNLIYTKKTFKDDRKIDIEAYVNIYFSSK